MKAKAAGFVLAVFACCVAYAGYGYCETYQFHLGGPVVPAGPGDNDQAGTETTSPSDSAQPGPENTPLEVKTHEEPGILMVQGWPVDLPSPECGNIIQDALRKNTEVYVADEACRAAMEKAFSLQRTIPPPDPSEVRYGLTKVMPTAPEIPTEQATPQTNEPVQPGAGERTAPFLKRLPN